MHNAYMAEIIARQRMEEMARVADHDAARRARGRVERRRWVRPIIWRHPLRNKVA